MNEYKVEYFIESDGEENVKLLSLNEIGMEQWRKDLEAQALSEYYNRKIEISSKQSNF